MPLLAGHLSALQGGRVHQFGPWWINTCTRTGCKVDPFYKARLGQAYGEGGEHREPAQPLQ